MKNEEVADGGSPLEDVVADCVAKGRANLADFRLQVSSVPKKFIPMAVEEVVASFKSYSGGNKEILLQAGFHLLDGGDNVGCRLCSLTLPNPSTITEARSIHFSMSPSCPFFRENGKAETQCKPQAMIQPTANFRPSDSTQATITPTEPVSTGPQVSVGPLEPYEIKYREYATVDARVKSFVGWPQQVVKQEPLKMAVCGFFYIGSADRVRCFSCGTTLRNWEPGDDPFKEHLTWAPKCNFIKAIRKPEGRVQETAPAQPQKTSLPDSTSGAQTAEVKVIPAGPSAVRNAGSCVNKVINGGSFGTAAGFGSANAPAFTSRASALSSPSSMSARQGQMANREAASVPSPRTQQAKVNPEEGRLPPEGSSRGAMQTPRPSLSPASASPASAAAAANGRKDAMATPQVLAVLEMGMAREVVEAALRQRVSMGQGFFPDATTLYLAAECLIFKSHG